jgi:hypothetical protein
LWGQGFHIESEKISLPYYKKKKGLKHCTLRQEVEQPNCHVTAEKEAAVLEGGV